MRYIRPNFADLRCKASRSNSIRSCPPVLSITRYVPPTKAVHSVSIFLLKFRESPNARVCLVALNWL